MRTEREIMEELEDCQKALLKLLETEGAILYIDIDFFRDRIHDLKQELRLTTK